MRALAAILLLAAAAPQAKENPQYTYWGSCKPGSWVRNRMEFDNQGQKMEYESLTRLVEVTPEKVVLETLVKMKLADRTVDSPPRRSEIKAADPETGTTVAEKDEEVTVAGKTLTCRFFEIVTESPDKKTKTNVKAWMSKDIPGGVAKSEVTSAQMKGPIRTVALEWEKK